MKEQWEHGQIYNKDNPSHNTAADTEHNNDNNRSSDIEIIEWVEHYQFFPVFDKSVRYASNRRKNEKVHDMQAGR